MVNHHRVRLIRRLTNQLRDPLLILLMAAVILTVSVGDLTDAVVIAMVIVVNTTVGVVQEVRADRAVTALASLSAPRARVILAMAINKKLPLRMSYLVTHWCWAREISSQPMPNLCESAALLADESSVTGESVPVEKDLKSADQEADAQLAAGTVVVRGRGVATVTGERAESARSVGRPRLLDTGPQVTALQRLVLRGLSRLLAVDRGDSCASPWA